MGEHVTLRMCSEPTDKAAEIYRLLHYTSIPSEGIAFISQIQRIWKICSTHEQCEKMKGLNYREVLGEYVEVGLTDNSNQEEIQQPFLSITKKLVSRHLRVFL